MNIFSQVDAISQATTDLALLMGFKKKLVNQGSSQADRITLIQQLFPINQLLYIIHIILNIFLLILWGTLFLVYFAKHFKMPHTMLWKLDINESAQTGCQYEVLICLCKGVRQQQCISRLQWFTETSYSASRKDSRCFLIFSCYSLIQKFNSFLTSKFYTQNDQWKQDFDVLANLLKIANKNITWHSDLS